MMSAVAMLLFCPMTKGRREPRKASNGDINVFNLLGGAVGSLGSHTLATREKNVFFWVESFPAKKHLTPAGDRCIASEASGHQR